MIRLESVKPKNKRRLGRGISAGQGKTAGRGTKGQKARAGYDLPRRFEGGQTPLSMRLPKLPGFKSHREKPVVISLDQISAVFKDGESVSLKTLAEKNLIKSAQRAKVLNNGELSIKVGFESDIKISKSAAKKFA